MSFWSILKQKSELKDLISMSGTDPRSDSAYDMVQLNDGVIVELEHTSNREVAKKIAKDHLDENPDYYRVLREVRL